MKSTINDYQKSKITMAVKTLKTIFAMATLSLFTISCNKDDAPTAEQPTVFNANDYSEFLTCKAGDFTFNTGNNAGNTSSIQAFKIGSTLYLNTSDGNFVSGSTPSMEINMQLKNFDVVNLKSYEVSGTYPTEILKYKHISGDNYDTNNGVNTTPQINAVNITKIENGYYTGTFSFTTYKVSNRATTVQVSQGSFKFKFIQ
jgi:hypothetical protein